LALQALQENRVLWQPRFVVFAQAVIKIQQGSQQTIDLGTCNFFK
jgi:hypothetical protein